MIDPVRAAARALFTSSLGPEDRVLITGAAGWFGRTIAALLHGSDTPALFLTQNPRAVPNGLGNFPAAEWDSRSIAEFAPTVVFDCAFILRDSLTHMSLDRYVHINTVLTSRLLQLASLASVRGVISVSSGAAIHPRDAAVDDLELNPYGYLKRQAELAVSMVGVETGTPVLVARPWSVSGGLVTRPDRYAFSNLILQARAGAIRIEANHPVLRRYIGVDDFFAVSLASVGRSPGTLNSGGELVEFSALASRITQTLGLEVEISRPEVTDSDPDDYYPRDSSWLRACESNNFEPADLDEQIRAVDGMLRISANPHKT